MYLLYWQVNNVTETISKLEQYETAIAQWVRDKNQILEIEKRV